MKNKGKVLIVCICFLASCLFATTNILAAEEEQLIPLLMRSKGIDLENAREIAKLMKTNEALILETSVKELKEIALSVAAYLR